MKEKLVYILSFALAFALVTGALIYLNSKFQNIFAFNFAPVSSGNEAPVDTVATAKLQSTPPQIESSAKTDTTTSKSEIAKVDSVKAAPKDTVKTLPQNKTVADTKKVESPILQTKTQQQDSPQEVASKEFRKTMKDSAYQSWVKKTVKLYEEMDAKKAAKVILGYSDNIARDILFSMKKRKAAEILTEFKPDVATRIINFN